VREELRQQVAVLAIAGAEQILAREVDEKVHKEALDKVSATL
jgi:F-type H+-transporting ATPase subunit b